MFIGFYSNWLVLAPTPETFPPSGQHYSEEEVGLPKLMVSTCWPFNLWALKGDCTMVYPRFFTTAVIFEPPDTPPRPDLRCFAVDLAAVLTPKVAG